MRAGALEAALSPMVGGSLLWLTHDGVNLLRHAPAGSNDPLDMASFPLLPYANRIANGRFAFDGREHSLPLNFGDHPHSIHGTGWQAPWTVRARAGDAVHIVQTHAADAHWPWAYHAQQHIQIRPDSVHIALSLTNESAQAMPAGLGLHPYFQADADTWLQFTASRLWLATPDMLPDRETPADAMGDWSRGAPVIGDSLIDNAYGGWNGRATIRRGDGLRLDLSASGANWLHVYRPPGSLDFCLEPVSHMPNAINRGEGMQVLAPGATSHLSMTILIDKCDEALPKGDRIA